jgi:hypothetical protein
MRCSNGFLIICVDATVMGLHYLVFPRALHNAFLKNWPQIGLYFTIEKSKWPYLDYKCAFQASNLVSLKSCSDVLTKYLKQLRKMLADTTR